MNLFFTRHESGDQFINRLVANHARQQRAATVARYAVGIIAAALVYAIPAAIIAAAVVYVTTR